MNGMPGRLDTTALDDEPVSGSSAAHASALASGPLAESIIYVCALLADGPRAIDRYIDYFGEIPPPCRRRAGASRARLTSPAALS